MHNAAGQCCKKTHDEESFLKKDLTGIEEVDG
jgi:hypothetical protein